MEIQLSKKYKLESDPMGGYNLMERYMGEETSKDENGKRSKTGETVERWRVKGYNMTIELAVKRVIDASLHTKNLSVSLKEFLELYKKEKEQITNVLS